MKSKKIPTYLKYYLSKTRLDGLVFNKTYVENLSGTSFYLDHSVEDKMKINFKASESTQNSTTGKNLITFDNLSDISLLGINTTYNNSEIQLNGTSTGSGQVIPYGSNLNIPITAGTYTLSYTVKSGSYNLNDGEDIAFILRDSSDTSIATRTLSQLNQSNTSISFNLEEDTTLHYSVYCNHSNIKLNNLILEVQLEQGNTATEYEPYTGGQPAPNPDYPQDIHVIKGDNEIVISNSDNTKEQNYPLTLGDLELCSINNYADEIFKNVPECEYYDNTLEEGKWYKYARISKDVLDGSQTITKVDNNLAPYGYYFSIPINAIALYKENSNEVLLCISFIPVANQVAELYHGKMTLSSTKNKVSFGYNDTLSNFITYVTNNNIILYFVLETPTKTLLSDTLQEQLENIYNNAHTYDKITNINQVNEDRPFILDISYYRKVK